MEYCKIYVVSHKQFECPENKMYVPIQVGYSDKNFFPDGIRDNTNNNIANKNSNYCELTALYWIWKNVHNVKNVGVCHYRRYFLEPHSFFMKRKILTEDSIVDIMSQYDIIVPCKMNVKGCVGSYYYLHGKGYEKDLHNLINVIKETYPDYLDDLYLILKSKSAFYCNMAIMPKEKFDSYCEWLFAILFQLESKTDLTGYTKEEARIYGYLSEILLNVWVKKNELNVKYLSVINTDQNKKNYFISQCKNKIQYVLNKTNIIIGD